VLGRGDPRAIASALDRALVSRAGRSTDGSPAARAAGLALETRGLVRVERLAEFVGVSRRQLERAFQQEIGLTPKQLLRVARFQQTLNALRQSRTGWADLAVSLGYYDQAHFVNDFRHFTGQPPGAWQIDDQSLTAVFSTGRRSAD
ncbi:MAG TPA: helix-turn-helix transcriptional regulator, partial [Vicinamibacterales bacterium]|nr:helix-turn-helix transcriptional regulator [Vicinamibacterales bacterium]